MKINPKKVKKKLKLYPLVSIILYRSKKKTRNKITVLETVVDNYNIDTDISEDFTKVYSPTVDNYNRGRNLNVFHSPCEIAFLYCSIAYALNHKELITEYRDSKGCLHHLQRRVAGIFSFRRKK